MENTQLKLYLFIFCLILLFKLVCFLIVLNQLRTKKPISFLTQIRDIEVPFSSVREAEIAYDVLRVDKEPPRSQVKKSLKLEKNVLNVCFNAQTSHQLRTGATAFLDSLLLLCETIMSFGPPV